MCWVFPTASFGWYLLSLHVLPKILMLETCSSPHERWLSHEGSVYRNGLIPFIMCTGLVFAGVVCYNNEFQACLLISAAMHSLTMWCILLRHDAACNLTSCSPLILGSSAFSHGQINLLILNHPVLSWCSFTAVQMARYSIMTIFLLKVKTWERITYLLEVTQQALVWSGLEGRQVNWALNWWTVLPEF